MSDFESIYREYGKTVYYFLLSLSQDEILSEELTQETMFRAIMNIGSFRGDGKISVWLCQIAKNLYFEWVKKNKRIVPLDESIDLRDSGRDIAAERRCLDGRKSRHVKLDCDRPLCNLLECFLHSLKRICPTY